jgi:hypothetical protein
MEFGLEMKKLIVEILKIHLLVMIFFTLFYELFVYNLDSIEYLESATNSHLIEVLDHKTNKHLMQWKTCQSTLPVKIQGHTLTVLKGKISDVAVDLRRSSTTFGKVFKATLSEKNNRSNDR